MKELPKIEEVLRMDEPWSLCAILEKLVEASEILLDDKNYDGHGWEFIQIAKEEAKQIITKL